MSRHPNRCSVCGSNYGHFRGCSLDDLSFSPEREALLRSNPEAASTYDVECLLEQYRLVREQLEIDRALVLELNNQIQILQDARSEIFRNAVDAMKAKEIELDTLRAELAESIGMWKGSLEAQHELEAEVVSLRAMAANLRLEGK